METNVKADHDGEGQAKNTDIEVKALKVHQLLDQLFLKEYGAMEISKHQNTLSVQFIDKFKF